MASAMTAAAAVTGTIQGRTGVRGAAGCQPRPGLTAGLRRQPQRLHLPQGLCLRPDGGADLVFDFGVHDPSRSIRATAATARDVVDLTVPRLTRMASAAWLSVMSR